MIHSSAHIEAGAQLGVDCEVMAGAVITRHAILGDRVVVHPGAVVGGDPQFLKFERATPTFVRVGEGSVIRENVTINRSIYEGKSTVIGARCFLMAGSHAGHDCELADDVVLANNVMLAGHVSVGSRTFIGGGAGIHQFCRIGELCMVAGLARVTVDVAPGTMIAERDEVIGLNLVGIKRRNWPRETVSELKAAFRVVYFQPGNIRTIAATARTSGAFPSAQAQAFLEFFAGGKRGFARPRREGFVADTTSEQPV
jgi:UDP-N-acetylglucosamine acyltransferase